MTWATTCACVRVQESQERATALAAEVVGLESGLLQCKSDKLRGDKQLEAKDQQVRVCLRVCVRACVGKLC